MHKVLDLLQKNNFKKTGRSIEEGSALRIPVEKNGDAFFLYTFDNLTHCQRAHFAYEQLHPHLFLVPKIQEFGEHWFTLKLEGKNLQRMQQNAEVSNHALRKCSADIGKFLRKLHNHPAPFRFGDPISEERDRSWLTFNGYVAAKLERYHEDIRKQNFSDLTVGILKNSIRDLRHQLSSFHPRTPPSWNHRRPSAEHTWVNPDTMDILAITGFEHSVLLPTEVDIAYLLHLDNLSANNENIRAFYRGYGAARTMDVQRRERFYKRLVCLDAVMKHAGPTRLSHEELVDRIASI